MRSTYAAETVVLLSTLAFWFLVLQFTHGKGAEMLHGRHGVQFLLAGISLGLLYLSIPVKQGLDEIVLQLMQIMLDPVVWQRALTVYGPAPHRPVPVRSARRCSIDIVSDSVSLQWGNALRDGRRRYSAGKLQDASLSVLRATTTHGNPVITAAALAAVTAVVNPGTGASDLQCPECPECNCALNRVNQVVECHECDAVIVFYPEFRVGLAPEKSLWNSSSASTWEGQCGRARANTF